MTLEDYREQYAKEQGFNGWDDLRFNAGNFCGLDGIRSYSYYMDQVARGYAQSQVNEAVSECIKLLVMFGSPNENKYLIEELKKLKR